MSKPALDWEAIEGAYRAGILSIREIAKQFDVSDTAIRKKAKDKEWLRDLTDKVQQQAMGELVRTEVRTPNARTSEVRTSERDIINAAAASVVEVVRSHRRDIYSARQLCVGLLTELAHASQNLDQIEDAIIEDTQNDPSSLRRQMMLKAVSLPGRAATIRDLSTTLKNLIAIERQAFSMDKPETDDNKKLASATLHIHTMIKPKDTR